ncbi:MAG: hypothetical protein U0414_36970 [Polyangiaceae bacterium]
MSEIPAADRIAEWHKKLPKGWKQAAVDTRGRWTMSCASLLDLRTSANNDEASEKCLVATSTGSIELDLATYLSDPKDIDGDGRGDVIVGLRSENVAALGFVVLSDRATGVIELQNDSVQVGAAEWHGAWGTKAGKTVIDVLFVGGGWVDPNGVVVPGEQQKYSLGWNGASLSPLE